jgi:dihydroxyacetone kinase
MVNGLGATPLMELMIATGKAVAKLQVDHGLAVERVYTGSFMTSLDMAGFSLSVMKVDQSILQRLDAPTKAPYWVVGVDGPRPPMTIPVAMSPPRVKMNVAACRPQDLTLQGRVLEVSIKAAAEELIKIKDSLNEWDSKVGDGDCGSTICRGASAILEDMNKHYPLNDAATTVNEIGVSVRRVMGGTSGVIYGIFCQAAYVKLKENSSSISAKHWADALDAAVAAVSKYGGAAAGYRTLLDALIPASKALHERLAEGADPVTAFLSSSEVALAGAESTKNMQAQAGRSAYVSAENLASVPDPGAIAAATWYRAAAIAVADYYRKLV